MYLRLVSPMLCSKGWLWTLGALSSPSRVRESQECDEREKNELYNSSYKRGKEKLHDSLIFLFNHSVTILFYATFIKVSQSILLSCLHFLSTVFTFIKYTVDSIVIFLSMHLDKWPPMAKAAMTQTSIWWILISKNIIA